MSLPVVILLPVAAWLVLRRPARVSPPAAPNRVTAAEATARLEAGFIISDLDGREIEFGRRALTYLSSKKDGAARKTFLEWAIITVAAGRPEKLSDRVRYRMRFRDYTKGKDKGFIVLVDVKSAEVWDFYRLKPGRGAKPEKRPPGRTD